MDEGPASDCITMLRKNLKNKLNELELTVSELAKTSGVPKKTLDNWLSGQSPRNLNQLREVARSLNTSIDWLCFGDEGASSNVLESYKDEILAGIFEVVIRKPTQRGKS